MRRLFSISILVLLFTLSLLFISRIETAHATSLSPAGACQSTYIEHSTLNVWIGVRTSSHCGSTNAYADSSIGNCDSRYHNAQTDTWQTRQVYSGGTRYNETGRSGLVTYPNNCTWYWVQESYLTSQSQLPDPSYGCGWLEVDSLSHTLDYQCSLFPNR